MQRTTELGNQFVAALEAVERRDEGAIEDILELFSTEARLTNSALKHSNEERQGSEGIRAFWEAYQGTFREVETTFFEQTSSEQAAGLFWTTRGLGAQGEPIEYDGVTLLQFDDQGKIMLLRGYYDTREFSRTVGSNQK